MSDNYVHVIREQPYTASRAFALLQDALGQRASNYTAGNRRLLYPPMYLALPTVDARRLE